MRISAKMLKKERVCNVFAFRLNFHFACRHCWSGEEKETGVCCCRFNLFVVVVLTCGMSWRVLVLVLLVVDKVQCHQVDVLGHGPPPPTLDSGLRWGHPTPNSALKLLDY